VVGLDVLQNDITGPGVFVDLHTVVFAEISLLLVLDGPRHVLFHLAVLDRPIFDHSHVINFINELLVFFIVAVEIVLRRHVFVLVSA
jgi:hypothetical protein